MDTSNQQKLKCMVDKYEGLSQSALKHLLLLQEKYISRFQWGLQGYSDVYVEIDIEDSIMEDIINYLPFIKLNDKYLLKKISKTEYAIGNYHDKYVMEMDLEETKEFFSIFEKDVISPKMDKAYILDEDSPHIFHTLSEEEMSKVFPDHFKHDRIEAEKMISNFQERNYGNIEGDIYCTKLVYFNDVHSISSMGILRFYFDYVTYDDGQATNFTFGKNKKQKVDESQKKDGNSKRKKRTSKKRRNENSSTEEERTKKNTFKVRRGRL